MKKIIILFVVLIFAKELPAQTDSLLNIRRWAFQLQNIDINQIVKDTSFQLVVIDYSSDGTDAKKFTASDISKIKQSGKKVLAYINIGEAESNRSYWQNAWTLNPPEWLGPEDTLKAGNYLVEYWYPQWQTIIYSYIDKFIQQGFDGIYMNGIGSYYYWTYFDIQDTPADSLMIQFVLDIRNYVNSKTKTSNFILIPQNGEDIINSLFVSFDLTDEYLQAINGVGAEDVFFAGYSDENNDFNYDTYRISQLTEYQMYDKPVFSIEYLTDPTKINQYLYYANSLLFIPYYCTRSLNQLCDNEISAVSDNNTKQTQNINVYPNPANSEIVISSTQPLPECFTVNMYNPAGNKLRVIVFDNSQRQNSIKMNIINLPVGAYIIELTGNNFHEFNKFIIER